MENQLISLLNWTYYCQGKTLEDSRQSLMCTAFELEQIKMVVQEELKKRDEQLMQLKDMLNKANKERDEAREKCKRLLLEKSLLLQQQQEQQRGFWSMEEGEEEQQPKRGNDSNNHGFSSSDCEESIVSSFEPPTQIPQLTSLQCCVSVSSPTEAARIELPVPEKPLPEKGRLLHAVMKAGPLLQTLLLAGPLPQWRHPPPPLETFEIPPVTIPPPPTPPQLLQQDLLFNSCGKVNRKRAFYDGADSPRDNKYQRIVLH